MCIRDSTTNYGLTYSNNNSVHNLVHISNYLHVGTSSGGFGVYYNVSDSTLKENVANTTYDASSVIKNLRFVDFDWKADSGFDNSTRETCGVIAQEVGTLDSSFIFQTTDPETNVVGKSQIVPLKFMTVSAKAIQELITRVETLETKVAALEAG